METRASPFVVGLFTLAVLLGVLAFVFWLGRYGEHAGRDTYQIVFSDEVTGLSRGSSVLYNGIRVGEVTNLSISPVDLTQVVATIQVDANVPMRADTRAQLQFQGITGIGLVQLRGGTADAPALHEVWDQPGPPLIEADRSQFQNLMDGAQSLLARLDSVADQVELTWQAEGSGVVRLGLFGGSPLLEPSPHEVAPRGIRREGRGVEHVPVVDESHRLGEEDGVVHAAEDVDGVSQRSRMLGHLHGEDEHIMVLQAQQLRAFPEGTGVEVAFALGTLVQHPEVCPAVEVG
jgi:hypothetical protein